MDVDLTAILAPVRVAMIEAARQAAELRMRHPDIKCKPGCSACCSRYMPITLAEAAVLTSYLKKSGLWAEAEARAKALRATAILANPRAWYKMDIPCPLLADNMCTVYPVRPVTCSAHFATSDPELCRATSTAIGFYSGRDFPEVHEAFAKAFNAAVGERSPLRATAPMPLALLFVDRFVNRNVRDLDELVKMMEAERA